MDLVQQRKCRNLDRWTIVAFDDEEPREGEAFEAVGIVQRTLAKDCFGTSDGT